MLSYLVERMRWEDVFEMALFFMDGQCIVTPNYSLTNLLIVPISEPASHGFVRFKIQQKRDLTDNSLITNQAAIYFDFNPPIFTNEVFHEVGSDFLEIASVSSVGHVPTPSLVSFSPNPAEEKCRMEFKSMAITTGTYRLMDCYGRTVMEQEFKTPIFELKRNGLPSGLYLLEIRDDKHGRQQKATWVGKVIWR